jgi:formylglycine-generating enzyme required for sulfatase activity
MEWRGTLGKAKSSSLENRVRSELQDLEAEVDLRRTYEFGDPRQASWHAQLTKLVAGVADFRDPDEGLISVGTSRRHSWGMEKRRAFAAMIEERSVTGADARERWRSASEGVRTSPKYGGFHLEPRVGLLPIGPDPETGLWEFSHLASADGYAPARRGEDGRIVLEEGTGIVLALIPGGTFRMGAQSSDPNGELYDPEATENESPVHEVTLQPFLLSKFEVTQAQWLRLSGQDPSLYTPSNYDPSFDARDARPGPEIRLHPVEQVSWKDAMTMLSRFGLTLPTEAQWEHACRAGTTTPYWSGAGVESLNGVANVSDAYGKSHGNEEWERWEPSVDDGHTVHASVGSYRPNAFGLFDMHGNVWEWCRDTFGGYDLPTRNGDAEREAGSSENRVIRGGSFAGLAMFSRSSFRLMTRQDRSGSGIGVRAAASLSSR